MQKYFDLTQSQLRIWETERFFQGTSINNIGGTLLLKEELDFTLWEEAIHLFIESNDSIRLHIKTIEGNPVQYLSPYQRKPFPVMDFTDKTKQEQGEQFDQLMKIPFQLSEDQDLFRFYLVKTWNGEQGYYIVFHHTVADAWTISLLGTQTMENYKRLKEGDGNLHQERPSYLEHIKTEQDYLNSSKFLSDQEYWLGKFKDKPKPVSIKTKIDYCSSKANRKTYLIDGKEAEKIRSFCAEKSTSPAVLFEAALCIYMAKFLNHWDIPFGSLVLNRSGTKEKAMTGMFISTIPLRVFVDRNNTFSDLCRQLTKEHMEVFRHQKYPYNILLSEIRKIHKIAANLYDFSISYQNSKIKKTNHGFAFRTTWYSNGNLDDSLCLHIDDRDDAGSFVLHFDYLVDLFSEGEIEELHKRILLFLEQGIENEHMMIRDMELTDKREQQQLLEEFNRTAADFPKDITIHELFEEQAERNPDKIALRFEGKTLTYRELNEKANRLARLLRSKGIHVDQIVGLMLQRSIDMIVGILGVMKAGAAYLPIDTEYPAERVEYLLNDSGADLVLIQPGMENKINFTGELLAIDHQSLDHDSNLGDGSGENLQNIVKPKNLVYVIYTSGSTGEPKGVLVKHENLVNAAFAWRKDYQLDQLDVRLLQTASFSFDVFAGDFCRALLNGGEMIICPNKDQYNPRSLYALIKEYRINLFESTPALIIPLMNYVNDNHLDMERLKILIIGSDLCPIKNFREIVERYGSQMRVLNSYGVTEATIDTSYYEESLENIPETGNTPIGKPMPNMKLLIVNEQMKLLPVGVYGELCIGGAGVTKGYNNKQELTAEKFVANPYGVHETLYRTGDLARFRADGNVEFMGRIDNQVKIRGLRIELGEIESLLLKHRDVEDAVVIAKSSAEGNKYLCGYFVSQSAVKSLELREYLLKTLPDYMVPAFFVQMETIPLTPNGKVDRNRLPEPDRSLTKTAYAAPRNKRERDLVKICREVLELKRLGIDDNLFQMGADSLSVIQIQIKTYVFDWNLTMQDFYKYPTIRQLSDQIGSLQPEEGLAAAEEIIAMPQIKKNRGKVFDYCSRAVDALKIKSVLLTGATGYLGVHILKELLIGCDCDIYCLIRGVNENEARNRLMDLLRYYFPKQDQILNSVGKRIFVINGDVTKLHLGLGEKDYRRLGQKADTIIHSAASVKHYGNYADFQKANVFGTQQMIGFARDFSLTLNHISTVSVSGEYLTEHPDMKKRFTEKDFYIGQNYMDNLYVRSKFEAEKLILKEMEKGLNATIFRMGNLTGRYADGMFQKNITENAFYNRLKSIIDMQAVPKYLLSQEIEFTPVDYAAKLVAVLSTKREPRGRTFHIFNHHKMSIGDLIGLFHAMSMNVIALEKNKFNDYVKMISGNASKRELLTGIINDLSVNEDRLNYQFPIEPDSKITREYIKKYGLEWPEIDSDYIRKIISHMRRVNFISDRSLVVS